MILRRCSDDCFTEAASPNTEKTPYERVTGSVQLGPLFTRELFEDGGTQQGAALTGAVEWLPLASAPSPFLPAAKRKEGTLGLT